MPELPEVEVVSHLIKPHLVGRSFKKIEKFTDKLRYPIKIDTCSDLIDYKICDIHRYGRYIVVELENLAGLIFHLGMTGQMRIVDHDVSRQLHDQIAFTLSSGLDLRFNCVRKFGFVESCQFAEKGGKPDGLPVLGPDPLTDDFSAEYLFDIAQSRRTPIKSLLMDNNVVPGIGNIYSAEVLFDVGIFPKTPANKLSKVQISSITSSVKKILSQSIEVGLAFNAEVVTPTGTEWRYPVDFAVYAREGEPCNRCSGTLSTFKLGGRSCFYCSICQPET